VLVKHALPVLDGTLPARAWKLGEEGVAQARHLSTELEGFTPLRLVSSPEPKARATAEIVATDLGVEVKVVGGLREIDRPVLPIMSAAEHIAYNRPLFERRDEPVVGDESAAQARRRFERAVRSELEVTTAPTVVAITHGTVIALFVAAWNEVDAFALWHNLDCAGHVVLEVPSMEIIQPVA